MSQLQTAYKPVNGNSILSQTQINYELFKMVVLSENSNDTFLENTIRKAP